LVVYLSLSPSVHLKIAIVLNLYGSLDFSAIFSAYANICIEQRNRILSLLFESYTCRAWSNVAMASSFLPDYFSQHACFFKSSDFHTNSLLSTDYIACVKALIACAVSPNFLRKSALSRWAYGTFAFFTCLGRSSKYLASPLWLSTVPCKESYHTANFLSIVNLALSKIVIAMALS
jgi:hypothetical protein